MTTVRFSKTDVDFHSEYHSERHAAVNVKDYGSYREHVGALERALADLGLACDDLDALAEAINAEDGWWDFAAEDGWEQASEIASDTFGAEYGVYSEGRSGGWLVVHRNGRTAFAEDEVAGWDALDVARWGRFAQRIRAIADEQPYRMCWSFLANGVVISPALAETGVGL